MLSQDRIKKLFFIVFLFLTLISFASIFLSRKQIISPAARVVPIKERQILTYFYYWYDLPAGSHSTSLTDHPADTNTSYKSVPWFREQLTDMEEAGIDTALVVYWSHFEPGYLEGLRNLIQARESLLNQGQNPPKIALFLDTGFLDRLGKKQKDFTAQEGKKLFYSFIKEFYAQVELEHWGRIEDRPIVWLWGSWFPFSYDQPTFDFVYEQFQKDFGKRPYIVREASWNFVKKQGFFGENINYSKPIETDDIYIWGAALDGYRDSRGNIAVIGPGYDERSLPGKDRKGRFRDRENGEWYEKNFQQALSSQKPILVIETWNEFHEASDIAESKEYTRLYINFTKIFSRQWKEKF